MWSERHLQMKRSNLTHRIKNCLQKTRKKGKKQEASSTHPLIFNCVHETWGSALQVHALCPLVNGLMQTTHTCSCHCLLRSGLWISEQFLASRPHRCLPHVLCDSLLSQETYLLPVQPSLWFLSPEWPWTTPGRKSIGEYMWAHENMPGRQTPDRNVSWKTVNMILNPQEPRTWIQSPCPLVLCPHKPGWSLLWGGASAEKILHKTGL